MTERKWTKGEWRFSERYGEVMTEDLHDGDDMPVCLIRGDRKWNANRNSMYSLPTRNEGLANAHLIAAAPELFEALDEMVNEFRDIDEHHMSGGRKDAIDKALSLIHI